MSGCAFRSVPWTRAALTGGWLGERRDTVIRRTLPAIEAKCHESGAWDAWRLEWRKDKDETDGAGRPAPGKFLETDVTKWIEAAAYSLTTHPDPALERRMDEAIAMIAKAQHPDGYVNVHFTVANPGLRFVDLRTAHELYCAGHLFEAAVAHHAATGKTSLLDVARRYAEFLCATFGDGPGRIAGVCGHPEIELALIRLADACDEPRFADLAAYFVNRRGTEPNWFLEERKNPLHTVNRYWDPPLDYYLAHAPLRDQRTAEGHAVRAAYLYAGAADVAARTGDAGLVEALRAIWRNVADRRMFVTGGIGSTEAGERFTEDYDLPLQTGYAETCAAIGLIFWAQRMLNLEPRGEYGDVLELALFNAALAGISLDGAAFTYANYLEIAPGWHTRRGLHSAHRRAWFHCACCPPNIARLLTSVGGYLFAESPDGLRVDLYAPCEAHARAGPHRVRIAMHTRYPWDGRVELHLSPETPALWQLGLRIPGWCRAPRIAVNSEPVPLAACVADGYAWIERTWRAGDRIELEIPMVPERLRANPLVAGLAGRVAIRRGPLVFALEGVDNGGGLPALALPGNAPLETRPAPELGGDAVAIEADGLRAHLDRLYATHQPATACHRLRFVPYALWGNRGEGGMRVWVNEA